MLKLPQLQILTLPKAMCYLPSDGILAKTATDKTVWLISASQRRGFVSASVFNALGFKFSQVLVITAPELTNSPRLKPRQSYYGPPEGLDIMTMVLSTGSITTKDTSILPYLYITVGECRMIFPGFLPANDADRLLPLGDNIAARVVQ